MGERPGGTKNKIFSSEPGRVDRKEDSRPRRREGGAAPRAKGSPQITYSSWPMRVPFHLGEDEVSGFEIASHISGARRGVRSPGRRRRRRRGWGDGGGGRRGGKGGGEAGRAARGRARTEAPRLGWLSEGRMPATGGPKAPATEEHRRRLRRRHRREGLEERRGPEGRRAEGGREGLRGGDLPPSPPSICTPLLEAPPPGRLQVQRPKIFAPPEAERCASLPSAPSPAHKETGGFFFPGGGCSQKGK